MKKILRLTRPCFCDSILIDENNKILQISSSLSSFQNKYMEDLKDYLNKKIHYYHLEYLEEFDSID